MNRILRGLGRPLFLSMTLLFGAFIALGTVVVKPAPAYAIFGPAGCACVREINDLKNSNCDCFKQALKDRIIGNGSAGTMLSETPERLLNGGSFDSLAAYFENVWWPRFLAVNQLTAKEDAAMQAVSESAASRTADAQAVSDTVARDQNFTAQFQDEAALAPEVLCPAATLSQSQALLNENARQTRMALSQSALDSLSGSPAAEGARSSLGPTEFSFDAIQQTIGVSCDPQGNNGANKDWCSGSGLPNAHSNASTVFGQTGFVESSSQINNLTYAQMFMERLFPDRFSNIRPDLLKPLSRQAAEVLHKQDAYKAAINTFQQPYFKSMAENTPMQGVRAAEYARRALQDAGIDGDLANQIIGSGGVSKAGMDKVIYQLRMSDPKTIIKDGSLDPASLLRGILISGMMQSSLLQEIRSELRETNLLLGGLGSVNSRDLYEEVQFKTNAISAR